MNFSNFKAILLIAFSLFCFSIEVFTDEIGEIVYIEEEVSIIRGEDKLNSSSLDIGTYIENYDLIKTGVDGFVEIEITKSGSQDVNIRVSADTAFAIEIDSMEETESTNTTFDMYTGTLNIIANNLLSSDTLEVHTESAVMGVRGTDFTVESAITGDILVSCEEGEVTCIDDDGEEEIAKPEYIVEKRPGEKLRRNNVRREKMDTYREDWKKERTEYFTKDALPHFKRYAEKYNQLFSVLMNMSKALDEYKDMFKKWKQDHMNKVRPPKNVLIEENKKVEKLLIKIHEVSSVFQKIYFKLIQMQGFHKKGILKGNITAGEKVEQFYEKMDKKKELIDNILFRVRNIVKLFVIRNRGHFPGERKKVKFNQEFNKDYLGNTKPPNKKR